MSARVPVQRRVDLYCLALLVGYGLFRTLMNGTYSTAMSTVRGVAPVSAANMEFSVASSFSILLAALALAAFGCLRPQGALRMSGALSAAVLLLMNLISGFGLLGGLQGDTATAVVASVWGLTTIVANAAWLVPFSRLGPRRCLTTLIASMLVSSLASLATGVLPGRAHVVGLTCVGAVGLVLFCLVCRMRDPVSPAALFVGEASPAKGGSDAARRTVRLLAELWGPLVIYASLTMLSGFATAFMGSGMAAEGLDEASVGNAATLVAVVFLAVLAFVSNRMFDLVKTFRMAFPLIAALLVALPFADADFGAFFRGSLSFLSTIVNVSMLFLLLETARVRQAPPVAVVGAAMLIARIALLASLVAGMAVDAQRNLDDTVRAMVLVVAGIYLLSMTLVLLTRKPGRSGGAGVSVPLSSEQVAFNRPLGAAGGGVVPAMEGMEGGGASQAGPRTPAVSPSPAKAARASDGRGLGTGRVGAAGAGSPVDLGAVSPLERRADELAARARLTPREREVVLLLAQGRSAPFIGNELGLSTNTVRGYVQEAYAKLDVHSKQELIDLLTREPA